MLAMATEDGNGMTPMQRAEATRANRVYKNHRLLVVEGATGVCGQCGSVQVIPNKPSAITKGGNPMRCPNSIRKVKSNDRRAWVLQAKYGLTEGDFELMISAQDNKCPICKTPYAPANRKQWHVDSNHETRRLRGILCFNCNCGLGNFKDDPEHLQAAIDYLERYSH